MKGKGKDAGRKKPPSKYGAPIKLLYEAEGMKITVELKNGEICRGLLLQAEDTMSLSLSEVIRTSTVGKISKLPNVYLRGSSIRFVALPDILKESRSLKRVAAKKRKLEKRLSKLQISDETNGDWVMVDKDQPDFQNPYPSSSSSCIIH